MWMARKLKHILQDLIPLTEQGRIKGFLSNARNADKLGGLLEDTRDAMMEYQVCTPLNYLGSQPLMFEPDFIAARYLR